MNLNIKINCHSSICIGDEYYFDPYNIKEEKHNASVVFITHPHYDHLDKLSIIAVSNSNTTFVCPLDAKSGLVDAGISEKRIVALLPNEKFEINGVVGSTFPSYNKTKAFHPRANNWLGYHFTLGGANYVVCGDTDATDELAQIKTDVLFVPIGGTYTMDASEAAGLVNKIEPKVVVPVHYGLIVGTKIDEEVFEKKLKKGIKCLNFID